MADTETVEANASKIIETYCSNLPQEIMAVTNLVEQTLNNGKQSSDILKKLHSEIHRMSGSALCMGFPFIGQTLMELETNLAGEISSKRVANDKALLQFAQSIESLAKLVAYARPENSQVLRKGSASSSDPDISLLQRSTIRPEAISDKRIMFADDDRVIRLLMRDVLNTLQIEDFEIHDDGSSLLQSASWFKPDIIITDWFMPPVGGMEIVRNVRDGRAGIPKDTIIIFLTSVNTLEKVQHALSQGIDHFLVKPFSVRAVERAVRRVTAHKNMEQISA